MLIGRTVYEAGIDHVSYELCVPPWYNRHSGLGGKYQLTSSFPFIRTPTGVMVYLTVSVACTISFT